MHDATKVDSGILIVDELMQGLFLDDDCEGWWGDQIWMPCCTRYLYVEACRVGRKNGFRELSNLLSTNEIGRSRRVLFALNFRVHTHVASLPVDITAAPNVRHHHANGSEREQQCEQNIAEPRIDCPRDESTEWREHGG